MSFLATFPEASVSLGNLHIRHDLVEQSVTILLTNWENWDFDTEQVQISDKLIHFIQPVDGELVGVKIFGGEV